MANNQFLNRRWPCTEVNRASMNTHTHTHAHVGRERERKQARRQRARQCCRYDRGKLLRKRRRWLITARSSPPQMVADAPRTDDEGVPWFTDARGRAPRKASIVLLCSSFSRKRHIKVFCKANCLLPNCAEVIGEE